MEYVKPVITDYGSLVEITEATLQIGTEDGGSKFDSPNHHSVP